MHEQLANIALQLVGQSRGQYDDQSLNAVLQVKQFLKRIADGELIVTERPKPPAEDPAP